MNITIKVDARLSEVSQEEHHRVKRVANVLYSAGHKVHIEWEEEPAMKDKAVAVVPVN